MNLEDLVDSYLAAWNQRDVAALLALMHRGASYYDAFWRETCIGRDLAQYFHDTFQEEAYWYRRSGDIIVTEHGIVFRYTAHNRDDPTATKTAFNGAEILTLHEGKIIAATDYYCNPATAALVEVARLAARRHGESNYAKLGLGALRASRFRQRLEDLMERDRAYLESDLTVSQLAGRIGCSVDHLYQIITSEYGTSFIDYLNGRRIKYACELLLQYSDDEESIDHVATHAGFASTRTFRDAFQKAQGESPEQFRHQRSGH